MTESDAATSAPNAFVPHPNLPSVVETPKTTQIFFPSLFPDHTAKYQVGSLSRDHARVARDEFMFCVSTALDYAMHSAPFSRSKTGPPCVRAWD